MQTSFFTVFRSGLRVLTRKLATEILVSSIATLLVMALFSNVMKATPPSLGTPTAGAAAASAARSDEKTTDFMEQVALSHVAGLKQAPAVSSDANQVAAAAPNAPTPAVVPPAPVAALAPHPHNHAATATHLAAADVLPPPRPAFDAPAPAVPAAAVVAAVVPAGLDAVDAPKKEKPRRMIDYGLRPLRFGMHVVTSAVDFVPATGTRVVEGVASVGDALGSFVKKL